MTTIVHSIVLNVDPEQSLVETWKVFAEELRKTGAQQDQINAMEMTFYFGAAQAYTSIDHAARTGIAQFTRTMVSLCGEIDDRLTRITTDAMNTMHPEGNA